LAIALAVTQAAAFVQQVTAPSVSLPSLRAAWVSDEVASTRSKRAQSFSAGPAIASLVVVAAVGALRKSLRQRAGASSRLPITMVRATQEDVVVGTVQDGEKNYVNPWEQKVEGHPKMGRKFHPYAGPVLNKVPIVEGLTFPLDPTKYTGPLEPPEPGVKWGEGREKDGMWRKRDEDGNVSYEYWQGIGRRKEACAIVQLIKGTGQFNIVSRGRLKDAYDYFQGNAIFWFKAIEPLTALSMKNDYDCIVKVFGGGHSGQAGAIRLGLAKALEEMDYQLRPVLMRSGFLKRDPRTKEMKKPGQPGARKKKPHHKR